ncbi:MAG: diguanylate cyclase [Thermodesulfobacteriota bacterium]
MFQVYNGIIKVCGMKLTIKRKLLFSYMAMVLLTVLASTYAVVSLQNLNKLAYTIINQDFMVVETSKAMMDALLAQESAEKKYLILKDLSLAEIFWIRSHEFSNRMNNLKKNRLSGMTVMLSKLASLHNQYEELFHQEIALVEENRVEDALNVSEGNGKKMIDDMASYLRAIQNKAEKDIDARMNLIKVRGIKASRMTAILSVISLVAGFSLAFVITHNISIPLRKLEKGTGMIAEGRFDYDLTINRHDEIGSLASAFTFMAERLKVLEALNLDASPLTRLPGNIAIEEEIKKRLSEKKSFSLCHVDLDNFKPFADKYGYAWGSEVIKEVANILTSQIRVSEQEDAFVGHVGGDDFVFISEPMQAEQICKQVVSEFDQHIPIFYSDRDREKGFIVGKDRKGVQQKFPLLTITIAIVTDDGTRFKNPLDMAKMAAELKEYAKTLPGSNYVKLPEHA